MSVAVEALDSDWLFAIGSRSVSEYLRRSQNTSEGYQVTEVHKKFSNSVCVVFFSFVTVDLRSSKFKVAKFQNVKVQKSKLKKHSKLQKSNLLKNSKLQKSKLQNLKNKNSKLARIKTSKNSKLQNQNSKINS